MIIIVQICESFANCVITKKLILTKRLIIIKHEVTDANEKFYDFVSLLLSLLNFYIYFILHNRLFTEDNPKRTETYKYIINII